MIKLSKKGSYALKAVIYIAKKNSPLLIKEGLGGGLVNIAEISESEKISLSMLRRIISELEKSGILETTKGRNGGIRLGKKVYQISVFDILDSVGEELGITDCTKGLECENSNNCGTEVLLGNLQKGFNTFLHIYTLDKIMKY